VPFFDYLGVESLNKHESFKKKFTINGYNSEFISVGKHGTDSALINAFYYPETIWVACFLSHPGYT
jgi:hypothetical protein